MSLNRGVGGAEQRRHYRVSSGLDALLVATLVLADGREIPAELVDLSAGGTCLRWPLATTPVLDLEEVVQLTFRVRGRSVPLACRAAVRWMGGDAGFVRYGFEFCEIGDLEATGDAVLWGLFNRRQTRRD